VPLFLYGAQDANLFTMTPVPVRVLDLVAGACRDCRSYLRPGVGLQYRVQPADAVAMLDPHRVAQILTSGLR
jgi:hypothetical protein